MRFVSPDCDFRPMVTRALAEGKVVMGFGQRKTPSPNQLGFTRFVLAGHSAGAPHALATADRSALLEPSAQRAINEQSILEAMGKSPGGTYDTLAAVCSPWGFEFADAPDDLKSSSDKSSKQTPPDEVAPEAYPGGSNE